jgi:DNA-binding transcriptional MerR regulator
VGFVETESEIFTIQELSDATGVEPRTIRSYVEKGLIPGPDSLGRGAKYPRESLDRLKVLQLLRDANRGLTLDQIRLLLKRLGPSELRGLADGRLRIAALLDAAQATSEGQGPSTAVDYLRSLRTEVPARLSTTSHHHTAWQDSLPVLEEAARALARLSGLTSASRGVRGEPWYRLPLTPDIELSVRGNFASEELAQLHRIGDALRLLLTKGPRA